jgi:hypothetical protein
MHEKEEEKRKMEEKKGKEEERGKTIQSVKPRPSFRSILYRSFMAKNVL